MSQHNGYLIKQYKFIFKEFLKNDSGFTLNGQPCKFTQENSLLWLLGFSEDFQPYTTKAVTLIHRLECFKSIGYFYLDGSKECMEKLEEMYSTAAKFVGYIETNHSAKAVPPKVINGENFYPLETDMGYKIGNSIFLPKIDGDGDFVCHKNIKLTKPLDSGKVARILTGDLCVSTYEYVNSYGFNTEMDGYNVTFHPAGMLVNTDKLDPEYFTRKNVRKYTVERLEDWNKQQSVVSYFPGEDD